MSAAEGGGSDPFAAARESAGVLVNDFNGEEIPMILRHADVREAAKDWRRFSSDAPFRVPIPSEEDVRSVRQLPIETDPPDHDDYRAIVEPFFRRALKPELAARIAGVVDTAVVDAVAREKIEVVHGFALPLQSLALACLLDLPESEAAVWTAWGTHVFRVGDGGKKGTELEQYIHDQLDRAAASPGGDFFSLLVTAEFRGRPLTREEMAGFANLVFAGGRDTIIQSIAGIIAHVCDHPESLDFLRADPRRIPLAAEEFVRVLSPLTHIGRRCPVETGVHGVTVAAGARVSLCWAAANLDPAVFDGPLEVRLDRRPNPHLAYGAGPHFCLGAGHARLVLRSLLESLCARVGSIRRLEACPHIEVEAAYQRRNGHVSLRVCFEPRLSGVQ